MKSHLFLNQVFHELYFWATGFSDNCWFDIVISMYCCTQLHEASKGTIKGSSNIILSENQFSDPPPVEKNGLGTSVPGSYFSKIWQGVELGAPYPLPIHPPTVLSPPPLLLKAEKGTWLWDVLLTPQTVVTTERDPAGWLVFCCQGTDS